ncbi:MAG: riboflavin biosynthesis protein RibF [Erysipelotrichaceae bacterium]|nr:riboflavin biosynthesis protein RibF [Erysipelotrichaceae bacterium]
MRIIQFSLERKCVARKPIVACIGYFDGLHRGHRQLIAKTIKIASEQNLEPSLITFDPDPWVIVKKVKDPQHLSTMRQRINMASSLGIKNIIILQFNSKMANLSYQEFEKQVLAALNIQTLICGFDFHYGHKGEGSVETLKQQTAMKVEVVDCVSEDNEKISSTRISELIVNDQVAKANELLGYRYQIEGEIIHGHKQGRTIGFPTANIKVDGEYILPSLGVYAGYIKVHNQWYLTMINVGHNPTFNESVKVSIEAFILDFSKMIYGEKVILEFDHFIRHERKFSNKSNLALQLEQDVKHVRKMLKAHE